MTGLAGLAPAALISCGQAPSITEPDAEPTDRVVASASPSLPDTADRPPLLVPDAEKGEKGARNVLLSWARALELGDYDRAFDQWGSEARARSGMTREQHAAFWGRFKTVTVAMPTGTMEGAAGSLYYTAPTTVVGKMHDGKPYRLEGNVVLRRVNDVSGATSNQLKWHIEQINLK